MNGFFEDVEDCASECVTADKRALRITRCGTVMMMMVLISKVKRVRISNLHHAENLQKILISCGLLEVKEYGIEYREM